MTMTTYASPDFTGSAQTISVWAPNAERSVHLVADGAADVVAGQLGCERDTGPLVRQYRHRPGRVGEPVDPAAVELPRVAGGEIEVSPAWRKLHEISALEGLISIGYKRAQGESNGPAPPSSRWPVWRAR